MQIQIEATQRRHLQQHLSFVHNISVQRHYCDKCKYRCKQRNDLTKHLIEINNINIQWLLTTTPQFCAQHQSTTALLQQVQVQMQATWWFNTHLEQIDKINIQWVCTHDRHISELNEYRRKCKQLVWIFVSTSTLFLLLLLLFSASKNSYRRRSKDTKLQPQYLQEQMSKTAGCSRLNLRNNKWAK